MAPKKTQHASVDCDKGPEIVKLAKTQKEQGVVLDDQSRKIDDQSRKIDAILNTLQQQTDTFNTSIKELTQVLLQNARHGEVLLQLKKENDLIFESVRAAQKDIVQIKERNAKCDGAGIFDNFPKLWDWYTAHSSSEVDLDKMWKWYLGELGWRRFVPGVLAVICGLLTVYTMLVGLHSETLHNKQDVKQETKQEQRSTYGINH